MKRSALDRLAAWVGLALAVVLLVAGALLTVASSFVNGQVASQLSAQKITMPTAQAYGNLPPADQAALAPYAGQEMTTGAQAEAFADHYIAAHLTALGGGKTYEEVSGEYIQLSKDPNADPAKLKQLGDLRQTMFMGATLRSMLLTAYAFGTMGLIAAIAAGAAFVGAVVLLVLALLGFRHAKVATGDALVKETDGATTE
jgi:ABC-type multidrug transport system fused ATPase/permease subunit